MKMTQNAENYYAYIYSNEFASLLWLPNLFEVLKVDFSLRVFYYGGCGASSHN